MNNRQKKQEQDNKLVAPTIWQIVNMKGAIQARNSGFDCKKLADAETGIRKEYWMAEAERHFKRANDYEFYGRA